MFHYTADGETVLEQTHDVSQIIKANKFLQNEQDLHHRSDVTNHVATIDMLAIKNWMSARGITRGWWREFMSDDKHLRDFLNDPDNKMWRTRLGKV